MDQQMGESSGVKSPTLGSQVQNNSVDQTDELLEAYAALEIANDGSDEQVSRRHEDVSLMLVGKLISDRLAKFTFMRDTLASVWRPVKGMVVEDLGNNIFIFRFFHIRDLQRILDDGPWAYDQSLLVLEKMRLDVPPLSMPFDGAEFWIQLHDLPYGFYSEKAAKAIGNFIGSYVCMDENNSEGWWSTFIRIRVSIDITKPLTSKMRIRRPGGEWSWISFRYERLPNFCFICGIIGHTEKFCLKLFKEFGQPEEKQYGAWIRAANRRSGPASGRRWLVLDHERNTGNPLSPTVGSSTNLRTAGTVPGTPLPQNIPQGTGIGREQHVSSDEMVVGEGTKTVTELASEGTEGLYEEDGLTIVDQKRRRVESGSPLSQPSPMEHDLNDVDIVLPNNNHRQKARFKFENLWLRDNTSREIMIESWSRSSGLHLMDRIGRCGKANWNWGKSFAKDFDKRLAYWRKRMESTKTRRDSLGISLFKEAQAQSVALAASANATRSEDRTCPILLSVMLDAIQDPEKWKGHRCLSPRPLRLRSALSKNLNQQQDLLVWKQV
nr:uncharacterized protein LOC109147766 [Ipomoea batatas]